MTGDRWQEEAGDRWQEEAGGGGRRPTGRIYPRVIIRVVALLVAGS